MNEARFHSIMANQTGFAKKVFPVVPKIDAWNQSQICAELARNGQTINVRAVEAALKDMHEAGLLVAVPPNRYRAVAVKFKSAKPEPFKEVHALMKPTHTPAATPAPAPAAQLANIPAVDRLVHMADALNTTGKMLMTVADDLTEIADSITRTTEADQANLQRLRQLQDLLRGIGMTSTA